MALPLAHASRLPKTIASKLGVEAVDLANIDEATITSHAWCYPHDSRQTIMPAYTGGGFYSGCHAGI